MADGRGELVYCYRQKGICRLIIHSAIPINPYGFTLGRCISHSIHFQLVRGQFHLASSLPCFSKHKSTKIVTL